MTALVRAELRKITSTKMWLGLGLGGIALVVFYVVVFAATAGRTGNGGGALHSLRDAGSVRAVYGVPMEIGYLMPLVFGVTLICGEFRHQTITATFLATPRRSRVVVAKLLAAAIAGVVMGVVFTVVAIAVGASLIAGRGYPVRLTTDGVPRLLLLGIVGLAVWAVFGLGFGALLKNQVAAILVALGLVLVVEGLLTLGLRAAHLGTVAKLLPSNASNAIVHPSNVKASDLLPWWAGALVLLAWGLATALAGSVFTMRRDVA
jgi:ABC-type transport system involved in multi-copper enzyme maturation permease subunit